MSGWTPREWLKPSIERSLGDWTKRPYAYGWLPRRAAWGVVG
jgi:hypothetical protein